jgi:hypothetical protein
MKLFIGLFSIGIALAQNPKAGLRDYGAAAFPATAEMAEAATWARHRIAPRSA